MPGRTMHATDGKGTISHREWLIIFDRVLKEVKEQLASEGRLNEFVGAKVTTSIIE